ncbi:urease accessory protein UreE [Candidatus Thioglobus sp.]|jgi:urease accessory protein|uniref:urease accessory protein UreE n=1 Tax=Candidatus Thioglobus sp. TaxID=2026721 RepID=UPI0017535483|nr:urease accessory protein UreE [Candidatus Thioglobus sp.]
MKEFIHKIPVSNAIDATITLTLEQRVKSRLKAQLDNGEDVGIFMQRGGVLEHGDLIETEDNFVVKVVAATELLSSIYTTDPLLLARTCYHLGNRHVELQITQNSIHYRHDHVLDEMVQSFGLDVISEQLPFCPEKGAYTSHSGHHEH